MIQVLPPSRRGYAIIGTTHPSENQSIAARQLAFLIAILKGEEVRTGGADGIDKEAIGGTGGRNLTVYLPWPLYNHYRLPDGAAVNVYSPNIHTGWTRSVYEHHPTAYRLLPSSIAIYASTYGIVEGSKAVIAFPGNNDESTEQGIRIAESLKIPIIKGTDSSIDNAAIWIGKTLQQLGFADSNLGVTLPGR